MRRVATMPILKGGSPTHLGMCLACHHCSDAGRRHLRSRVLSQIATEITVRGVTASPTGLFPGLLSLKIHCHRQFDSCDVNNGKLMVKHFADFPRFRIALRAGQGYRANGDVLGEFGHKWWPPATE